MGEMENSEMFFFPADELKMSEKLCLKDDGLRKMDSW